jgi:ribosomal protein S18 acetylase RimI-like enzyme
MSNQPAVSIRLAGVSDARLISTLATVSFFEAYFEQDDPHSLADYLIGNFAAEKIALELALPEVKFFIVHRDDKAVGYAKLGESEPHESITSKNAVELQRIYLVERVWGTGVGEILLECCLDEAKAMGKEVLWLGVWEENKRGRSFYGKHGFIEVGTLKFPYGDSYGINRVMQREL